MVHNVLASAVQVAQSLRKIGCNELLQQVVCIRVYVWWILHSRLENVFIDFHWRATVPEGSETAQHFKNEDAKRPPGVVSAIIIFTEIGSYQSTDLL